MALTILEAPALLTLLVVQSLPTTPPAVPARATAHRCSSTAATNGFDCCVHLTVLDHQAPTTPHQIPSVQTDAPDERTMGDAENR